jgi:hypothetical protein
MEEIWKPIKGYEGLYEVSNIGRVKRLPYTCIGYTKGHKRLYLDAAKEVGVTHNSLLRAISKVRKTAAGYVRERA